MQAVKDKNIPKYGVVTLFRHENFLRNTRKLAVQHLGFTENLLVKSEINVNKSIRLRVDTG